MPVSDRAIRALQEGARRTSLPDGTVDFVVTSPPYINVFNYHQHYRASSECLNGNVLPSARGEIGSNRSNRGNRFLTVTQYCIDMALVFNELNRVCKERSTLIFVVGRESSVRNTAFRNGEIVSEVACSCCGLDLINRQERAFVNRFGAGIHEDILHFRSSRQAKDPVPAARSTARAILANSLQNAPDGSKTDLIDAIGKAGDALPSPFFQKR
jgi:hypothetical protein